MQSQQDRLTLIKTLWGLTNDTLALQYNELVKGIATKDLIAFNAFCYKNKGEFESMPVAVAKNAKEFIANQMVRVLQSGAFRFQSVMEMVEWLRENFKGKAICNGENGNGFLPFVILRLSDKGNLFSTYTGTEHLRSEPEFFAWLFVNQHKIGKYKFITEAEYLAKNQKPQAQIENQTQEIDEAKKAKSIAMIDEFLAKAKAKTQRNKLVKVR